MVERCELDRNRLTALECSFIIKFVRRNRRKLLETISHIHLRF